METLKNFLNSFVGANSIQIYIVAFMVVFFKIVFKYITKMDVLKISRTAAKADKQAVHFECLRVGVDLVLLGIVSFLGVIRLAFSIAQGADKQIISAMSTLQVFVIVFQLCLLGLATLFTGIFDSAASSYKRGIYIPNGLGILSVILSVGAFFFISQGR